MAKLQSNVPDVLIADISLGEVTEQMIDDRRPELYGAEHWSHIQPTSKRYLRSLWADRNLSVEWGFGKFFCPVTTKIWYNYLQNNSL